ncbi:MAG TPA: hypothetical protein VHS31_17800 [Tepidisphaeraceae bacterium]|jgi:hypothetical protein|nr:hypothetical protein [Tepidisphaeraceae bacterium]
MLKAHLKISIALLCCAICVSCQPAFDPNGSVLDPRDFYPDAAEAAFTNHLDKYDLLPQRFEIEFDDLKNDKFKVLVRHWPHDGTWASAVVDMHSGKAVLNEIHYSDNNNWGPATRPSVAVNGE